MMIARTNDFRVLVVLAAIALAVSAAALMLVGPPASAANTLVVDDDQVECENAGFTSIQAAVEAAEDDDLIRVCPGVYEESVVVDKPLTLKGDPDAVEAVNCFDPAVAKLDPTQHTIVDPADTGFSVAFKLEANNIDLSGFAVQGASVGIDASDRFSGYRVHHNLIRLNTLFGMDFGSEGTRPSRVDHNCFRGDGLQTRSYGLVSELDDDSSYPRGPLQEDGTYKPRSDVARDLINASIDHNSTFRNINALEAVGPGNHDQVTFANNVSREDILSILIQNSNPKGSRIVDNQLSPIRFGIGVGGANAGLEITGNVVDSGETGIIFFAPTGSFTDQFLAPTTKATISGNTVTNQIGPSAIRVFPGRLQDSRLLNNTVSNNDDALTTGIFLTGGNNDNKLLGNTANGNTGSGIQLLGNTRNVLLGNTANGNTLDGIQLLAGSSGNTIGGTNDGEGNTANYNGRSGIHATLGAIGNTFKNNSMHNNGGNPNPATLPHADARDDNLPTGEPPLLQNTWTSNTCVTDIPAGYICPTS